MAVGEQFKFPDETNIAKVTDSEVKIDITHEDDAEVEVEVYNDTPIADQGRKPLDKEPEEVTDAELAEYGEKVQKRIKELAHGRHDERRAKESALREREELERIARSALEENKRLKQYVNTGEQAFATTLKSAAEGKLENAKRKYKEAHEAFDTDGLLAAQQELTEAQWELNSANNFKPTPLQTEISGVNSQSTEQATVRPDTKALAWQQRNQWYGADRKMTTYALAVHEDMVNDNVDTQSEDYYRRLDAEMHDTFPKFFGTASPKREDNPRQRPANVVASSSRSATGASKVKISATAAALIKKLGITEQEYAKNVIALEHQNGR